MSGERVFLDTNIIVYAYDRDAGRKHEIARNLLIELWNAEGGVLSTQVLQEFYVTVTKKIASPMPPKTAKEIIADFLTWDIVTNDGEAVLEAIDLQIREKISFWDALVVAAAEKGGADILLSEDLSDGRKFGDLAVRNPFAESRTADGA
jgi:predicted nucleic acid-binding protein